MAARNLVLRTRREYVRDRPGFLTHLERQGIPEAATKRLSDLEGYLAKLDRRRLLATSRNGKRRCTASAVVVQISGPDESREQTE